MSLKKFYACSCFLNRNYFLEKYNLHVAYNGENYLPNSTKELLLQQQVPQSDFNDVLTTLQTERSRRSNLGIESLQRNLKIKQKYTPLHSHLYELQKSFFDEKFLSIVNYARNVNAERDVLLSMVEATSCNRVWQFPVFTSKFCNELIEELENFQLTDLPKGRPNTMNHYGALLNELGFDELFFDHFRLNYLQPIAKLLFPEWCGDGLDSHKVFTVSYKEKRDLALSYHFDNAEVSLNVCLGKAFEEGELYFGGMNKEAPPDFFHMKKIKHKIRYGVIHRGQHLHGAMPISGEDCERHNLIMWMRSSSIRNSLCPMCNNQPTLIELPYGGDGFTVNDERSCHVV